MSHNDFSNLGEDIKNIVGDAINSMDFEKLNQDIRRTVKDSLEQARNGLAAGRERMRQTGSFSGNAPQREAVSEKSEEEVHAASREMGVSGAGGIGGAAGGAGGIGGAAGGAGGIRRQRQAPKYKAPDYQKHYPRLKKKQYLAKNPSGSISGTLLMIFGSIFGSSFGIAAFVILCVMMATGFSDVLQACFIGFFVSAVVCGGIARKGTNQSRLVKRFYQYSRILGDRTYCQLEEFSSHIGKNKRFIVKDVRRMIEKGMFPQGHIDDQETCLMITDESYQQYRQAQEEYRRREKEKKALAAVAKEAQYQQEQEEAAAKKSIFANEQLDRELLDAYSEGKRYLDEIIKVNKGISEPKISQKVSRLEVVIRRIFKQVQEHPEQLEEIRRFMEYYLPTTLKLVSAYSDFDAQPVQGENISSAKKEISETLDTINEAFTKLLDSLFESAAFDISTDISVMNTILAQEGLVEDEPFRAKEM